MRIVHGCRRLLIGILCAPCGCQVNPPASSADPAEILSRATVALRQADYQKAVDECEDAIRLQPKDAPVFCLLAHAYQMLERPDLAGAFYLEALRIDPKNQEAMQGLCRLSVATGRYDILNYYFRRMQQADSHAAADQLSTQVPSGREASID